MKILLLEDDPFFMKLLTSLLSTDDGQVDTVSTAGQAMELLRSKNYDLLVTDLVMEGMNGFDLVHVVLAEGLLDRDHIFVVTGLPTSTVIVRTMLECGIRVLPKPFTKKQFTHALKSLSDIRRPRSSSRH
jgi:ATP-dependent Lon protease